jgi:hypothetical protein
MTAAKAIRWALALALVPWLLAADSGCARLRKRPAPPPVCPEGGAERDAQAEAGTRSRKNRLMLDPAEVLTVQMQALEPQREAYADERSPGGTRTTDWLDRMHETVFCRLDNAVRRLDTWGLREGSEYKYKASTFKLSSLMRAGGRGDEKDFDFKLRFNARLALPRIERELYLIIDNSGRNELPGSDPLKQESDTRLGLRAVRRFIKKSEIDVGGGVRLRSSGPVAYGDLEWRWKSPQWGGGLELTPRGYYYSDEGFGQMTTLIWTKPVGDNRAFQIRVAERSSEATHGLEFEQTVRFAWYRSGRKRGWVVQGSVFPHLKSSELYWDNALINITWRDALYKKWIYYSLTPQVEFAKEDRYSPQPSLRIGLEILFGGQLRDLM